MKDKRAVKYLAEMIRASPNLALLTLVPLNMVNFRYVKDGGWMRSSLMI